MGLLDDFSTLSDSAKQYALNALARFGNGVGNTVQAIPGNAQKLAQGLLNLPHDVSQTFSSQPGGLLSPQLGQQINQAMSHPQPANPGQWMDQGMALAGMAPVTAPIGMFIGQGAKTWDAIAAQKANEMLQAGHDPRQVWQQTGTMRGVDGHLRQEIPDNLSSLTDGAQAVVNGGNANRYLYSVKRGDILSHANLDSAYPDTQGMETSLFYSGKGGGGTYHPSNDSFSVTSGGNLADTQSTTLHELQHAIQQREGWAKGGSPDDMRQILGNGELTGLYSPQELNNAYLNLAGEAEARLTQARMNLTPEQRLQHYPYDPGPYGLDVPQNQLIVRGLLGHDSGPSMSTDGLLGMADNAPMPSEYGIAHRPPMRDSGAPLHDLTGGGTVYPDDIYSPNASLYYGHFGGNHPMDTQTMSIIQKMRGNPNGDVTIYRAIPSTLTNEDKIATLQKQMAAYLKRGTLPAGAPDKGWYDQAHDQLSALQSAPPTAPVNTPSINPGDWVTINRNYAKDHGESALNGEYKILSKKVKAKDIFTNGDSIHEFGYDPQ